MKYFKIENMLLWTVLCVTTISKQHIQYSYNSKCISVKRCFFHFKNKKLRGKCCRWMYNHNSHKIWPVNLIKLTAIIKQHLCDTLSPGTVILKPYQNMFFHYFIYDRVVSYLETIAMDCKHRVPLFRVLYNMFQMSNSILTM